MNSDRIKTSLENIFQDDRTWEHLPYKSRRIVFWYDPEAQFQQVFDELQLENIRKYQLSDNAFTAKYHLLIENPDQSFLVYAPFAQPNDQDNWLIDIQSYSQTFAADPAALLFADFKFHQRNLEHLIRQHIKFFSDKRTQAIAAMNLDPQTSDRDLLLAMLSVLAGIKAANADMLLRQVLSAGLLESDNKYWIEFQKFNLGDKFWAIVKDSTGFNDLKPSLDKLLKSLLITHFQMTMRGKCPEILRTYILSPSQKAYAFVEHWTNDRTDAETWIELSKQIEAELNLESAIADIPIESIYESNTFECIDRILIRVCVQELKTQASDLKRWQKWFDIRRTFIWHDKYPKYANTYRALSAAIELLTLTPSPSPMYGEEKLALTPSPSPMKGEGKLALTPSPSPMKGEGNKKLALAPLLPFWEKGLGDEGKSLTKSLFSAYTETLYLADRHYRKFIVASDDGLPILREQGMIDYIEQIYVNGFLAQLGEDWTKALQDLQNNLQNQSQNNWQIEGIPSQQDFFQNYIQKILQNSDREKVFVIISDALRYEVATELKEQIEKELRGNTKIEAQLGLLPSITKVGMAALLSGSKLEFTDDFENVLRDRMSTQGAEARQKVLQATAQVDATVISAAELLKMNSDQGREAIKPYRLIYIYHDNIDSIGDKAASERQVMAACDTAIAELLTLVKRICNSLNGTRLFITADHGFLYQRQEIAEPDKIPLPNSNHILKSSRRYLLQSANSSQPLANSCLSFTMPYDIKQAIVVVPKGNLRFAKQGGGSQFVHGGASLQEICVPVISYHHKRAEKGDEGRIQKVGVQVVAHARRVTNNRFTIRILQTEPVEGRWRSRTVTIALYDPQTNKPITDIKTIELNSTSPQPTGREFSQILSVTVGNPPVNAQLIVRDRDDDLQLVCESWTVSLAISDDFGDF